MGKQGFNAAPLKDDILTWVAVIPGFEGSVYEDAYFSLIMEFDEFYPQKPPCISFISEMFHPNIYSDGRVCLELLKSGWSPSYDVKAILLALQGLLSEPNINSPANNEAAQLLKSNPDEYLKKVKEIIIKSYDDIEKAYKEIIEKEQQ